MSRYPLGKPYDSRWVEKLAKYVWWISLFALGFVIGYNLGI